MKQKIFKVCFVVALMFVVGVFWNFEEVKKANVCVAKINEYVAEDGAKWEYSISTDDNGKSYATVRLSQTNGGTQIVCPDYIEKYPVCSIIEGEGLRKDEVEKISIPATIKEIGTRAFYQWKSLEKVIFVDGGKEIGEESMNIESVEDEAFAECTSLKELPLKYSIFLPKEGNKTGERIYANCSLLKKAEIISKSEQVYIPSKIFEDCRLEEGISFGDNIKSVEFGASSFRHCKIKNLKIPVNCVLGRNAFSDNLELNTVEFLGNVYGEERDVFLGDFQNGGTICFGGENVQLKNEVFENCNANQILFDNPIGTVWLGEDCINNSGICSIQFKNKNVEVLKDSLYSSYCNEMYNENDAEKEKGLEIEFNNNGRTIIHEGAFYSFEDYDKNRDDAVISNIKINSEEAYFDFETNLESWEMDEMEIYINNLSVQKNKKIIFGTRVREVNGKLDAFLSSFEKIYLENPGLSYKMKYTERVPEVYAYTGTNMLGDSYTPIQEDVLQIAYDEKMVVDSLAGMDLSKLHVATILKTGTKLEVVTGCVVKDKSEVNCSEKNKYFVEIKEYSMELGNGIELVVYYQDVSSSIYLKTIPRTEEKIEVQWNKEYINTLIEDQKLDVKQLVEKVKVFYNDKTVEEKSADSVQLENSNLVKGKNIICVFLKENSGIKDSTIFDVDENPVVKVTASYVDSIVFIGDKVDKDKIKLEAEYKVKGKDKEREVSFTKLSKEVFEMEGKNIIRVYYTDDIYSDMEILVKEPEPVKVEASYKKEYICYGEESINNEAIDVRVTLENKKEIRGFSNSEGYALKIVANQENQMVAVVEYKGVCSEPFCIPLTENKLISIQPALEKEAVIEGTYIGKEMISYVKLVYQNGNSYMKKLGELDQDQLTISKGYMASSKEWNDITVTYMGITGTARIWGEEDSVVALEVLYTGSPLKIGQELSVKKCKVYLLKKSGLKTLVQDSVTIINPKITKKGDNFIYVCYGVYQGCVKVEGVNLSEDMKENETSQTKGEERILSISSGTKKIELSNKKVYQYKTNKQISFSLLYKDKEIKNLQYQFVVKGEKIQGKNWCNVKNKTLTIKDTNGKFGVVYFRYTLSDGSVKKVYTSGFLIDKVAPAVNVKKNQKYKSGKKLAFSDQSGIQSAKLDGKTIKSGTRLNKKGKHTLKIVDAVGNSKTVTFYII